MRLVKLCSHLVSSFLAGDALSYATSIPQLGASPFSSAPALSLAAPPAVVAGKQTEGAKRKEEQEVEEINPIELIPSPLVTVCRS